MTYIHILTIYDLAFDQEIFGPYVKKNDKIFKSNYVIFDRSMTYPLTKKKLEEIKILLDENVIEIKNLVDKIGDLDKITLQQKIFFLCNESFYINHILFTELNKKVQTYGLISTGGIGLKSRGLITPKTSLKFNVLEKKYKEKIVL